MDAADTASSAAAKLQAGMFVETFAPLDEAHRYAEAAGPFPWRSWAQLRCKSDAATDAWVAVLPSGKEIVVQEHSIRVVPAAEIEHHVLLGPLSHLEHAAAMLSEHIETEGYGTMHMLTADRWTADLQHAAAILRKSGTLAPLQLDMQESLLGRGSDDHVGILPTQKPAKAVDGSHLPTPIAEVEGALSSLVAALREPVGRLRGISIVDCSPLMMRLPNNNHSLDSAELNMQRLRPSPELVQTLRRGKLLVLLFIGPGEATLTLAQRPSWPPARCLPTTSSLGVPLDPCSLAVIDLERFQYTLEAFAPDWLALQLWCLGPAASFQLDGPLSADLIDQLGIAWCGPRCPEGKQPCIASAYNKFAINSTGIEQYWQAVGRAGGDGACVMPLSRWDYMAYYDEDPDRADGTKYYCRHFSVVEGIEYFDNRFFNLSPAESLGMDPSQRQILEVGAIALCAAGYSRDSLQRKPQNIGIFVGSDHYDWKELGMLQAVPQGTTGSVPSILSNRFSFCMNCRGPSFTLDSACSSSLVGTHAAKLHLLYKDRLPAMLSAGVMTIVSPLVFMHNCQAHMLSPDGRCFTFNDTANGFLRCEAVGCIVMKNEVFDEEHHHCLISASNSNQDGRSAGLTAPSGPAQVECLTAVLEENKLSPNEVDITECHGTGTALGDPIEMGSVRKVFDPGSRFPPRLEPFLFGSVKSNHGHAEGGAGLTGLMKCMLQVMHQEAAQCLHIKAINPHVDFEGFPMQLIQETNPVRGDSCYAGVTGMGFGGTNAHVQVWGKNIMTSRRKLSRAAMESILLQKLEARPSQDQEFGDTVAMGPGMSGLDPAAKPGDKYILGLQVDGKGIQVQKVDVLDEDTSIDEAGTFGVRGSFSDWQQVQSLKPDLKILGLHRGIVPLGASGQVEVQVVAGGRADHIYGPKMRTSSMLTEMVGPADLSREQCWVIQGLTQGRLPAKCDVMLEFFHRRGGVSSMTWRLIPA